MITFALCITMGKSQGWGHSQNALRDLLGILAYSQLLLVVFGWFLLVLFGWLANVYTSVVWIASFSSFLFMFCSTLPSFLPPLPQDVASNISMGAR